MKTPPFLLLATLLFWGWQSDFLLIGAIMGVVLEGTRFIRFRWELDDADFSRIWSFCVLLNVALAAYVFTTNDEAGGLAGLIHGNAQNAVNASTLAVTRFMSWMPMTLFAFVAAQLFNVRPSVPLTGISLVLRWRRRKGEETFAGHYLDISYPYFMVCAFAASIHPNIGSQTYFWGQCVLVIWALWFVRSPRFRWPVWLLALVAVFGVGFSEMAGINQAQRVIQNFNAQWMAHLFGQRTDPLQSMTSMGRIGRLKLSPKIVIWLEPEKLGRPPVYLREASYRNYQAQKLTWFAGGTLNDFEPLRAESDGLSWILQPAKSHEARVNIACYLNGWSRELEAPAGLLPLPSGSARLENTPANMVLKKNRNGAVLAAGRGLMIFDAVYGDGATIDSPPDISSTNRLDLVVPPDETNAIQLVADEINLPGGADDLQKRRAVEKFFYDKFTYSTWQGLDKQSRTNATPLTKFLLTSRSGHCEYFASAAVLLLRSLGIPARYAVGYYIHEPYGSGYIARERDAHAWCLAWNREKQIWEDFDTTPPSWVSIESRRSEFGVWFADARAWLGFQYAKFRWGQAHLQQYILWALIPVMAVLLYHIIFRRLGKLRATPGKNQAAKLTVWQGLDSDFYQLEKKIDSLGMPRQRGEALTDWLERALVAPALTALREPLRGLLRLHYRHRFDPRGLNREEREALRRQVAEALQKISSRS